MTLQHRTGDLFASDDLDALAHGCNCAGAMGKGIAVEFKRRWPDMYREYRARCLDGRLPLGDLFAWQEPGLTIYNLGTQPHWRRPAELPAIDSAVRKMLRHASENGVRTIGMPQIGAGLGRLNWEDIEKTITAAIGTQEITVIVHRI